MQTRSQNGVAVVAALLVMLLLSTLLAGFTVVVVSDQQNRYVDRERIKAFYAGHAGIEQLTAALGGLYATNVSPTAAQISALQTSTPSLPGIIFVAADGSSGYTITFSPDVNGNPASTSRMVSSGPFEGMTGLVTPYQVDVTAKTAAGGEVHLRRPLQTVAIPVFQFGVFSETDLSFFPGPPFNFGGRVHSNGNLFLASGNALALNDRVTAVGEVIRTNLSNGWATSSGYTGAVNIETGGAPRPLATTEGSLVGTIPSAQNEPTWTQVSMGTYAGKLRNGRTGARRLDLALATVGGQPSDLVRRPATTTENITSPVLFGQRYFSFASVRILLSDTAAAIQNLPTVTAAAPLQLDGDWTVLPPGGYNPPTGLVDVAHPPVALSSGINPDGYRTPDATGLLGGFLKIEAQDPAGNWRDVTMEILNLGFAGKNLSNVACNSDPNPNAIIRIQHIRDVPTSPGLPPGPAACGVGTTQPRDYWPNALYDPREGNVRDTAPGNPAQVALGGVMHYVELDVNNLRRWFLGQIGTTGTNVMNTTGYVVYFSDRRNNRNGAGNETGEYGFEDTVNPADPAGAPNGVLDAGEDVSGNGILDVYGQNPIVPAGGTAPLDGTARPGTFVDPAVAQVNRAIFFRRALKLTNGTLGNIVAPGLTVVSENPVYVQGNYNANAAGFGDPHVATAILADAVTLLSNNWNDNTSFQSPNSLAGRPAATTWYRVAIMSGKTPSFPKPAWAAAQDFGTDGGVHNFLRYIENWGGSTLNYRGSLASFYFSRQATGTYKCCTLVYSPPTRAYAFDIDFLTPALLPPRTPLFRDLNTLGFTQITTAGR